MFDLVVLDAAVFCFCLVILNRGGRLSHSHPAVIYLIFHFLVVTFRLWALANGAEPLFRNVSYFQEPTITELRRAVVLCDVALIAMTAGCIQGRRLGLQRIARLGTTLAYRPLSERIVRTVSFVALPIGLWGLITMGALPGSGGYAFKKEGLLSSSYAIVTFSWGGLALLALIYFYGFRRWLVGPMFLYLVVAGTQGGLRFRFFIPVILLIQIWLDRSGRRWPSTRALLIGLTLVPLFFPLKAIGSVVQEGGSTREIVDVSRDEINKAVSGQSADQTILDQFAITLTLTDDHGRVFLGEPYLALITLPVPRLIWPEKPGLADHLSTISTYSRPIAELGMVTTVWGDAYLNFWYAGVILVPYLLGRLLTRFYTTAYQLPYHSATRFGYLLVASNLVQVFRDGIISLPIFVVVQMLPLTAMLVWHRIAVPRRLLVSEEQASLRKSAGSPASPLN